MKKKYFAFLTLIFLVVARLSAQSLEGILSSPNAVIDSSRLPLVLLHLPATSNPSDPIPDSPKITADMAVINNGYNVMNHVADPPNAYSGKIGIEKRGSYSQMSFVQQKSYALETRDSLGNNNNVSLLGMPKDNDWVLYGPFDDHTLMRNVLTYKLARDMGAWAPRTRYCEVQFYNQAGTPDYRGLYAMVEKIKKDNNRVDISTLDVNDNAGDSLTGGYIFAIDKNVTANNDSGWISKKDANVSFVFKYPKYADITSQQGAYLQSYVDSFETVLQTPGFADPVTGYRKYIDVASFIDYFIIQELSKNIDSYRRSSYFHKDKRSKGGKLYAGPHWDYNSAWSYSLCGFDVDTGWAYSKTCFATTSYHVPFWWSKLLTDAAYKNNLKCRWTYLRSTVLDTAHIFHIIDSITGYVSPASVRHFSLYSINKTLKTEATTLKTWIAKRLKWMDSRMPGTCSTDVNDETTFENSVNVYPNPSSGKFDVQSQNSKIKNIEVHDVFGRNIQSQSAREGIVNIDISSHPSGVYFMKCYLDAGIFSKKVVKID